MFDRFTDRSRTVLALANHEAFRFNHEYVSTEHILLGLVKEGSGVGANVLKNLGVDLCKVRLEVEKLVKSGPDMVTGKLPQTPRVTKAIEYAIEEARNLNHNYVGTEHLLLGLLREQGVACDILNTLNMTSDDVRFEVMTLIGVEKDFPEMVADVAFDVFMNRVKAEYISAASKYGSFKSTHEGYAIIKKEVDELWDGIKKNDDSDRLREEAIQIAAMAIRFCMDLK